MQYKLNPFFYSLAISLSGNKDNDFKERKKKESDDLANDKGNLEYSAW